MYQDLDIDYSIPYFSGTTYDKTVTTRTYCNVSDRLLLLNHGCKEGMLRESLMLWVLFGWVYALFKGDFSIIFEFVCEWGGSEWKHF